MKTALYGLIWILVAAIAFAFVYVVDSLPVTNDGIAARTLDRWSGVLTVWNCGGWKPGSGSFTPWLKKSATRFEKQHPGVRVQVSSVDEETLAGFKDSENPPDVMLFTPGEIDCNGLLELDIPDAVRDDLAFCGQYNEKTYAIPVAIGGYAWSINTGLIDSVPYDWSQIEDLPPLKKQKRYVLDIPADTKHLCWSAALVSLCAPRRIEIGVDVREYSGIDLGLTIGTPEPSATPESRIIVCKLPKTLPDNFGTRISVYNDFISGKVAAIPVTQREIANLTGLTQAGKGISWQVQPGGGAFSDQILLAGVVNCDRSDAQERRELSKRLVGLMLTEELQAELTSIRAFSVIKTNPLYHGQYGMEEMETMLNKTVSFPNAFDQSFRESAKREVDRLINPE